MKNYLLFISAALALENTGANAEVYSQFDFQLPNTSAAGSSYGPKTDDAGNNVAFVSSKYNMVLGDNSNFPDVFIKNLRTNVTKLLSRAPDGTVGNNASSSSYGALSISGDGKTVAFVSSATNLLSTADGNVYPDCFFVKLDAHFIPGPVVRISPSGVVPNLSCVHVAVNYDGSKIAFASNATNIGFASGGTTNVYMYDAPSATVTHLSTPGTPMAVGSYAINPSINSIGDAVVWQAQSIVDLVGYPHIFLRNSGGIVRIDTAIASLCNAAHTQCGDAFGNGGSSYPAISDAGMVTWQSSSKALVASDPNGNGVDVFKRQLPSATEAVAQSPVPQATFNGPSFEPSISATTSEVVFVSLWNGFITPDANQSFDLFLKNGNAVNLLSKSSSGGVSNSGIRRHDVSHNGSFVVFDQNGGNYPGTTRPNIGTSLVALDRVGNTRYDLEVKINGGTACLTSVCSVTVKNLGPDTASNVTLTVADSLGNFTLQAPVQTPVWVCQTSGNTKYCTRSALLANETATFVVQNLGASINAIRADLGAANLDVEYSNNAAVTTLPAF